MEITRIDGTFVAVRVWEEGDKCFSQYGMNATSDLNLLATIRVASPCSARWADMQGDERARFCSHCQKHVYNFAAMKATEVEVLIREKEGNLCGRFFQRTDGTVLTADCAVGITHRWRRVKAVIGATTAGLMMAMTSIGLERWADMESPQLGHRSLAEVGDETLEKIREWFGLSQPKGPQIIQGMIGFSPLPVPLGKPPVSGSATGDVEAAPEPER